MFDRPKRARSAPPALRASPSTKRDQSHPSSPNTVTAPGKRVNFISELSVPERRAITKQLLDAKDPKLMEFYWQTRRSMTCGMMVLRNALQPQFSAMVHESHLRIIAKKLEKEAEEAMEDYATLSGPMCTMQGDFHICVLSLWCDLVLGVDSLVRIRLDEDCNDALMKAFSENYNLVLLFGSTKSKTSEPPPSGHFACVNYVAGRVWLADSASPTKMPEMITTSIEPVSIEVGALQALNYVLQLKPAPNSAYVVVANEATHREQDMKMSNITDAAFEEDLDTFMAVRAKLNEELVKKAANEETNDAVVEGVEPHEARKAAEWEAALAATAPEAAAELAAMAPEAAAELAAKAPEAAAELAATAPEAAEAAELLESDGADYELLESDGADYVPTSRLRIRVTRESKEHVRSPTSPPCSPSPSLVPLARGP